jgi:hypothetical protein
MMELSYEQVSYCRQNSTNAMYYSTAEVNAVDVANAYYITDYSYWVCNNKTTRRRKNNER